MERQPRAGRVHGRPGARQRSGCATARPGTETGPPVCCVGDDDSRERHGCRAVATAIAATPRSDPREPDRHPDTPERDAREHRLRDPGDTGNRDGCYVTGPCQGTGDPLPQFRRQYRLALWLEHVGRDDRRGHYGPGARAGTGHSEKWPGCLRLQPDCGGHCAALSAGQRIFSGDRACRVTCRRSHWRTHSSLYRSRILLGCADACAGGCLVPIPVADQRRHEPDLRRDAGCCPWWHSARRPRGSEAF